MSDGHRSTMEGAARACRHILAAVDHETAQDRPGGRAGFAAWLNALLLAADQGGDEDLLHEQCEFLWAQRYLSVPSGRPTYGLNVTFDAFDDTTVNAATTGYAANIWPPFCGLVAAYKVTGRSRYLDWAAQLADTLATDMYGYESGSNASAWYSDNANDQVDSTYVVHNTGALALLAWASIDRMRGYDTYATKRTKSTNLLVAMQGIDLDLDFPTAGRTAPSNWRYQMISGGNPNDLSHEIPIVYGLIEEGTAPALTAADASLTGIWDVHFNDDGSHAFYDEYTSSPWAVMIAMAARPDGFENHARLMAKYTANQIDEAGVIGFDPTAAGTLQLTAGVGLASYVAMVRGCDYMLLGGRRHQPAMAATDGATWTPVKAYAPNHEGRGWQEVPVGAVAVGAWQQAGG